DDPHHRHPDVHETEGEEERERHHHEREAEVVEAVGRDVDERKHDLDRERDDDHPDGLDPRPEQLLEAASGDDDDETSDAGNDGEGHHALQPYNGRFPRPGLYDLPMPDVRYEVTGAVARATIDRPDRRNSMSFDVMEGLREAVARAKADETVRVLVLTGAGDKAFCAGADLGGGGIAGGGEAAAAPAGGGAFAGLCGAPWGRGRTASARAGAHSPRGVCRH